MLPACHLVEIAHSQGLCFRSLQLRNAHTTVFPGVIVCIDWRPDQFLGYLPMITVVTQEQSNKELSNPCRLDHAY